MTAQSLYKAVALISSGLDSLLAAKLVRDLGIEVYGVNFYFQFDSLADKVKNGGVQTLLEPFGIPIQSMDVTEDYLPILLNPEHGYGSGVNPCIDCHLFMLKKAKVIMDDIGAHFLVTGEVVGQRPMSQNKPILLHMNKISGLGNIILRPLSAKLLPVTLPEEKGWIDREKLLEIRGRSRKIQLELVKKWGIKRFGTPAGGCVLTDPIFSKRLKKFITNRGKEAVTIEILKLLRYGRHFWVTPELHVIVGRNAEENLILESYRQNRWRFFPLDERGPLVLAQGVENDAEKEVISRITARYSSGEKSNRRIIFKSDTTQGELTVDPILDRDLEAWRV